MQSNKSGSFDKYQYPELIILADHIFWSSARIIAHLSLAGLIGSGLYLKFMDYKTDMFSHGAIYGLHILLGIVVIIDVLFLFSRNAGGLRGMLRAKGEKNWKSLLKSEGPLFSNPIRLGYWITLLLLIFSGAADFLSRRYGFPLEAIAPPFGWGVLHGLLPGFFLSFLALRIFFIGKIKLKTIFRYLLRP